MKKISLAEKILDKHIDLNLYTKNKKEYSKLKFFILCAMREYIAIKTGKKISISD